MNEDTKWPKGFTPPTPKYNYESGCDCIWCTKFDECLANSVEVKMEEQSKGMTAKEAIIIRLERSIKLIKNDAATEAYVEINKAQAMVAQFKVLLAQAEKMQQHVDAVQVTINQEKKNVGAGADQ